MDHKRLLEERLREAVCEGDTDAVQDLVNIGVDVNARQAVSGWTPLHWACKKGYLDVAALLLKNGADKNVRTEAGETAVSLCNNQQILYLLSTSSDVTRVTNDLSLHTVTSAYTQPDNFLYAAMNPSKVKNNTYDESGVIMLSHDELVLKIRIASTADPDFVEIELPRSELTYQALLGICCKELNLTPHQILKLRKLPNTRLRKDKDIQRLQNFQEIEVITTSFTDTINIYASLQGANGISNNLPTLTPANGYQSISKKDQTILY
ncbi:PREDICTED: ankyrin repeat domain-containing protein 40-like [Dinoponera quadriceps]|uniref:Ankyrin repeat domain-containing protein 40-like n=1 Tax=Dinoponera quadriceps TaxID=609295 RepID=A0A6P3XZ43_DINQU|nr:PREDICTED: ankyrin repeat domain-containing protein 40-like [Dinoponera quadriceps]